MALLPQVEQDPGSGEAPLLEVRLELAEGDIGWTPPLEARGVRGLLEDWLAGFLGVGGLVEQLQASEEGARRTSFRGFCCDQGLDIACRSAGQWCCVAPPKHADAVK